MAQVIADHSTKAANLAKQFREKWTPILAKHLSMFQSIVNGLLHFLRVWFYEVNFRIN